VSFTFCGHFLCSFLRGNYAQKIVLTLCPKIGGHFTFGHPEISKLAAQLEESIRIDNIEQITERYTVLSLRLQQVNPLESCDQNKEP